MVSNQQFRLKWNNHRNTVLQEFETLLFRNSFVDCTIGAEGKYLKAHKIVLSACSPYLQDVFNEHFDKHPVILLKDVTFKELKYMIDYMYCGEVNISECDLPSFLRSAQSLKIKGLAEDLNHFETGSDSEIPDSNSFPDDINNSLVEANVEIHDHEPSINGSPQISEGVKKHDTQTHLRSNATCTRQNIIQDTLANSVELSESCLNFDEVEGSELPPTPVIISCNNNSTDSGIKKARLSLNVSNHKTRELKVEPVDDNGADSNYEIPDDRFDTSATVIENDESINTDPVKKCENGNEVGTCSANISSVDTDANGPATNTGDSAATYRCFQCSRCLKLFRDGLTLWSHVSFECRKSSTEVYNCEFCVYKSKWKSNLKRHKIMVHKHLMEATAANNASPTSSTAS